MQYLNLKKLSVLNTIDHVMITPDLCYPGFRNINTIVSQM